MLDMGSGVYKECNFGAVLGNVHGYGCCLSSQWKQMPSKLLGWCSGRKSVGSTGVARLLVASRYAHPPRWACRVLRMLPPRWLHEVSDSSSGLVSRMKEACSARFPANGFGTSIVYVLAGHSGVYVGKARLDRKKMCGMGPRALEHVRALLYTNVRDGMKPRYRILRRSLGSVFMLPAIGVNLK